MDTCQSGPWPTNLSGACPVYGPIGWLCASAIAKKSTQNNHDTRTWLLWVMLLIQKDYNPTSFLLLNQIISEFSLFVYCMFFTKKSQTFWQFLQALFLSGYLFFCIRLDTDEMIRYYVEHGGGFVKFAKTVLKILKT
ncbi:MAG: hypothetical protein LUC94_04930 [Clostridiales bacterium]|nr:hypothetical protein [Clostridiales bacterium]